MKKSDNGAILVTTLWILTLLTFLALGIGIRSGIDVKLTKYFLNSCKARYIADAGIKKALALLKKDNIKNVDSLNEIWSSGIDQESGEFLLKDITIGDGSFTVGYKFKSGPEADAACLYGAMDEEGKLNINKLDGALIAQIPGLTEEIAQAIMDWRDEDDVKMVDGAETYYYEGLDSPYTCKNGDFAAVEELMLVKGVTRDVYEKIKDIVTVYGDDKALNINTASRDTLMALFGQAYSELADKVIDYRNGSDGTPGTRDDNVFTSIDTISAQLSTGLNSNQAEMSRIEELRNAGYIKVVSNIFRINSTGAIKGSKIKKTIEAVVKRSDKGFEFLYYHES